MLRVRPALHESAAQTLNSTPGSSELDHVALPVVRRWRLVVTRDLHNVKHDVSVRAVAGGAAGGLGEAAAGGGGIRLIAG